MSNEQQTAMDQVPLCPSGFNPTTCKKEGDGPVNSTAECCTLDFFDKKCTATTDLTKIKPFCKYRDEQTNKFFIHKLDQYSATERKDYMSNMKANAAAGK